MLLERVEFIPAVIRVEEKVKVFGVERGDVEFLRHGRSVHLESFLDNGEPRPPVVL